MSWTRKIHCFHCYCSDWRVKAGVWTCRCGKPMTVAEIKHYAAWLK